MATTVSSKDDILEAFLKEHGIACYRGSEDDVMGRFAEAARQFKADEIVRITADDPLKDHEVIERVVRTYLNSKT